MNIPVAIAALWTAAAYAALPEAPHQHDPWVVPKVSTIPADVVKLSATLFDAGLADPRGGVYREIEVPIFVSAPDGTHPLTSHGWVFDDGFAVCWNGLIYRVRKVGPPAQLEADVHAIASVNPMESLPFRRRPFPKNAEFWLNTPAAEGLGPISIALLLRLGRADLAQQLWSSPHPIDVPEAIRTWLGTAFLRVVDDREQGDDEDAAQTAQSLIVWQESIRPALKPKDIAFLSPLPRLLEDSERRLREPPRTKLDSEKLLHEPQSRRIAELIARLEDVIGVKIGWPGPYELMFDPICRQLAHEGEAAVEPLLDAYEFDRRLTRDADFTRPSSLERTPIPVSEAAKAILAGILQYPNVVNGLSPAELRAWWEANKKDPLARSFQLLLNDSSSPDEWVESAEVITQHSGIERLGDLHNEHHACDANTPPPPLAGEPLRSRREPSVTELLAKRANVLRVSSQPEKACSIAFMAYLWDPQTSLPVLRQVSKLESCRRDASVTSARLAMGDTQAAADWSELIRNRRSPFPLQTSELSPLWMFPNDAVLSQLAESLFSQPDSRLAPGKDFQRVATPLLANPTYRRAVISALRDNTVVGSAIRDSETDISIRYANGGGGYPLPGSTDSRHLRVGESRQVRTKDLVAWQLTTIQGFPDFWPDWSELEKDMAASEMAAFLDKHGAELELFPRGPKDAGCLLEKVLLTR